MIDLDPGAKKGLVFIAGLVVVLAALAIILFRQGDRQIMVKYENELALAKSYRMVVDEEDLKRFNPKIPDSENAALLYGKLSPKMTRLAKVNSLTPSTSLTESLLNDIRKEVADAEEDLNLLEEAAKLKSFWVDLSFFRGEGSIMVSHSKVYAGTQFLLARALLAKLQGNESAALKDLRTISNIVGHLYRSKDDEKFDMADEISWTKAEFLTAWAAEEAPGSIWNKELKTLADNYVVPGPRDLAPLGLYYDLAAIEATRSRDTREKFLGMKDSEERQVSAFDVTTYTNRGFEASKIDIIEGWRMVWVEIEKSDYANPGVIRIGDEMISEGLRSNPWLSGFQYSDRIFVPDISEFRLRKLALQVAVRILAQEDRTKPPSMTGLPLIRHSSAPTVSYFSDSIKIICYDSRSRRPDLTLTIPLKTP